MKRIKKGSNKPLQTLLYEEEMYTKIVVVEYSLQKTYGGFKMRVSHQNLIDVTFREFVNFLTEFVEKYDDSMRVIIEKIDFDNQNLYTDYFGGNEKISLDISGDGCKAIFYLNLDSENDQGGDYITRPKDEFIDFIKDNESLEFARYLMIQLEEPMKNTSLFKGFVCGYTTAGKHKIKNTDKVYLHFCDAFLSKFTDDVRFRVILREKLKL